MRGIPAGESGSGSRQGEGPTAAPFPVGLAIAFYGALAAVAVGWRLWADGTLPLLAPGAPGRGGGGPAGQAGLGGALGLALVVGSRAWTARSPAGRALADALARALGPLSGRDVLLLALFSGIAEEAFFRGALQPRVGWFAASLLFALAHFVPRRDLAPWAAFALLAGVLFGGLFEWTGSLVAPATAHVVVNALNLRWLADASRRAARAPDRSG